MRFDIITLFPELFTPFLTLGVTRRAYDSGQIKVHFWNPRDYSQGQYKRVDDRPFGGGPGMVMMAEPLDACLQAIRKQIQLSREDVPLIYFSPVGQTLNQAQVQTWSTSKGAIFLCGRYEGVDQRFIDQCVDHQISLGDFVLSGGEIPALALLDSLIRLLPGVLNDDQSHQMDSFNAALDGLLDCPHYTRPETWQGQAVPATLLSGHHAEIIRWRKEQSLAITAKNRPDLIEKTGLKGKIVSQSP
ncbi:MAG: tRNA (guanosine(37)-N1)-methyltransferase TrmD [Betaproteobacteria bacterium]|jgi:tRNA (guanine37-N1)-methyltransferase|nr:tRNA (guanosine(37)-N1)-methyltransferase TrmD [Betaproteobacteria bacterium]NBT68798.1 tRNA (guanosine(37)-N1)-methyltransferase TrmD [Betaproteobacteria bacterium]NBY08034.1 tRNA (guanosine(37)-N1)-methyltransferase TrmD [Betaproteobacteria bacterium]